MRKLDKLRLEIEEREILVLWKVCQYYEQDRQNDHNLIKGYNLEGHEEEELFRKVSSVLFHGACVFNLHAVEDFTEQVDRAETLRHKEEKDFKSKGASTA